MKKARKKAIFILTIVFLFNYILSYNYVLNATAISVNNSIAKIVYPIRQNCRTKIIYKWSFGCWNVRN